VAKAISESTTPTIFHNLSVGEQAREDALKAALIAKGITEAEGFLFRATVSEALRETLDSDKIREEMGPSWCSLHSKIAVVTTVRVNARKGIALPVAA
jgi:hypothetical protein